MRMTLLMPAFKFSIFTIKKKTRGPFYHENISVEAVGCCCNKVASNIARPFHISWKITALYATRFTKIQCNLTEQHWETDRQDEIHTHRHTHCLPLVHQSDSRTCKSYLSIYRFCRAMHQNPIKVITHAFRKYLV